MISWKHFCLTISLLCVAQASRADTLIAGTDITSTNPQAAVLCPNSSNCLVRAEQFTLSSAVIVDDIKVVLSTSSSLSMSHDYSFTIGLSSSPANNTSVGGSAFSASQSDATRTFDFSNLGIALGPGTYYLGLAGGNVIWDYAQLIPTAFASNYAREECDPTLFNGCQDASHFQTLTGSTAYAFQINGNPIPEPSSLALLGTGALGAVGAVIRGRAV